MQEAPLKSYEELLAENIDLHKRLKWFTARSKEWHRDEEYYLHQLREMGENLQKAESDRDFFKSLSLSQETRDKARRYDGLRFSRMFACYAGGCLSWFSFKGFLVPEHFFQNYIGILLLGLIVGIFIWFVSSVLDSFVGLEEITALKRIYLLSIFVTPLFLMFF